MSSTTSTPAASHDLKIIDVGILNQDRWDRFQASALITVLQLANPYCHDIKHIQDYYSDFVEINEGVTDEEFVEFMIECGFDDLEDDIIYRAQPLIW